MWRLIGQLIRWLRNLSVELRRLNNNAMRAGGGARRKTATTIGGDTLKPKFHYADFPVTSAASPPTSPPGEVSGRVGVMECGHKTPTHVESIDRAVNDTCLSQNINDFQHPPTSLADCRFRVRWLVGWFVRLSAIRISLKV